MGIRGYLEGKLPGTTSLGGRESETKLAKKTNLKVGVGGGQWAMEPLNSPVTYDLLSTVAVSPIESIEKEVFTLKYI